MMDYVEMTRPPPFSLTTITLNSEHCVLLPDKRQHPAGVFIFWRFHFLALSPTPGDYFVVLSDDSRVNFRLGKMT